MSSESYAQRLTAACPGLVLRPADGDELAFLCHVYATTRLEELSVTDWAEDVKFAFLTDQALRQHEHYTRHYVGAEFLVIESEGERVGRLYLNRVGTDLRLMDIALITSRRGQGIGTRLVAALIDLAREDGCEITLHVEPLNPAQRMYRRFGFRLIEDRGVYHFLGRAPDAAS